MLFSVNDANATQLMLRQYTMLGTYYRTQPFFNFFLPTNWQRTQIQRDPIVVKLLAKMKSVRSQKQLNSYTDINKTFWS